MKGRKTCPECKTQVGARLRECECGYSFVGKPSPKKLEEPKKWLYKHWVYATALSKPYLPLEDWISEMRQLGIQLGKIYSNECLYRYIRDIDGAKELLEAQPEYGPCIPSIEQMLDSELYFENSRQSNQTEPQFDYTTTG